MKELSRLALVLTVITAGAALLLAMVESVTRDPIAQQRRLVTLNALKSVLPPADNSPDQDTVSLVTGKDKKGNDAETVFYRGRQGEDVSGIAFTVVAPDGYSGNISIMVGIDPVGHVSGIEVLQHAETPGLGAKVEESWWKEQFKGKGLDNADWRVKKDGGEFDQITAATITPRAIVGAVRRGLEFFKAHKAEIIGGA
ncbi:MAG: RnfABCDGE type electron transport complex subunit G [Deltaproteobacteria bacterium]|nr:RnfABCDGE type electron transport complex subunit G [Deltaproteobacteria bacterium]